MRDQHGEIGYALALGLVCSRRIGGGGSLESDSEENHFAVGIRAGDFNRFDRRIRDPDIRALRLGTEQIRIRAWDAEHVAIGAEDYIRPQSQRDCFVDSLKRSDADGTSG